MGTGPFGIVVADLDADGKADVATANNGSDDVTVLRGNGDGTFAAALTLPVADRLIDMAAADLDKDGRLDLAVTAAGMNRVEVILRSSTGAYRGADGYLVSTSPNNVAIGDVNRDGTLDLAVLNALPVVSVLLGAGNGTFASATSVTIDVVPTGLVLGDWNGDGKPDLAVTTHGANFNGSVSVLLGDGTGAFTPGASYPAGREPWDVAAGDLNGDGKLDLAVSLAAADVFVFFGNGDGTFVRSTLPMPQTSVEPVFVRIADADGDGTPDLVTANSQSNTVSVLLGVGDGHFQSGGSVRVGTGPEQVAVGNLNGDGRPDLVVTNQGSNDVTVLLGTAPRCP